MKKLEFMHALYEKLSGLPEEELEERLAFYGEMIDDRMEEGLSEEESVAAVGSVEAVAAQVIADIPLGRLVKEKIKPQRRLAVWEMILLALGSPLWLSLLIALFAVILSLYFTLWSVILTLWAGFASILLSSIAVIAAGIGIACFGHGLTGLAWIGAGLVCGGIGIFFFFGCLAATRGTLWLTKKIALGIKHCFIKKEGKVCADVQRAG